MTGFELLLLSRRRLTQWINVALRKNVLYGFACEKKNKHQPKNQVRSATMLTHLTNTFATEKVCSESRGSSLIGSMLSALIVGNTIIGGSVFAADIDEDTSFVLIAADGIPADNRTSFRYTFRQVDVASKTFLSESFTVSFSSKGSGEDELKRPKQLQTTMRFAGKKVPAGDFALVSITTRARNGRHRHDGVKCFSLGTMIYSLRGNQVSVVPIAPSRSGSSSAYSDAASDVSTILAQYPKLSSKPAAVADVIGSITFDSGTSATGRDSCMVAKTFEVMRIAR
jgi:hypothetical protein